MVYVLARHVQLSISLVYSAANMILKNTFKGNNHITEELDCNQG